MGKKTGISWTDHTFNPWHGCQKISPACDHCYAERDSKRFAAGQVLWGSGSERRTFGDKHWQAPLTWAKTMPAKMGRRPRVFCASMGDWLDLDAPITEFVRLLDTIRRTPELDWLLLSKRIGNWRKRLGEARAWLLANDANASVAEQLAWIDDWVYAVVTPANIWLGSAVVNQEEADRDIPKLLAVPARVRFVSIEPMLGPIDLTLDGLVCQPCQWCRDNSADPDTGAVENCRRCEWTGKSDEWGIDWVIAGGESGPHARPSHPDWYRSLRDQCDAAGVAFHFKQWGEWAADPDDDRGAESRFLSSSSALGASAELMVRVGKRASGRLLDGIEQNGFPTA